MQGRQKKGSESQGQMWLAFPSSLGPPPGLPTQALGSKGALKPQKERKEPSCGRVL